jgi:spore germination protein KA
MGNMETIYLGDVMIKIYPRKRKPECRVNSQETNKDIESIGLDRSLDNNISLFKNIFKNDETLSIREFQNKRLKAAQCCIIYIDGMVNIEIINENIIQPVLRSDLSEDIESDNLLEELKKR